MNPVREIDHDVRLVRDVGVFVRQYIWRDGASSFDVHRAGDQELLRDESFDHNPSDAEIEQLPYIAPSIRRAAPGVYEILSGPHAKGPYPSRAAAQADISAGNW